jgi:two-component system, OmpR family, sensor histidine kinase BaeS
VGARTHGCPVRVSESAQRLALLVHEVRSPVAALGAIAEACRAESIDDEARRTLVDLALAACRAIERLVSDGAVGSVRLERTDLADVVRESVQTAALGGASVRAAIEPGLPRIDADRLRLRQALDNLISNAATHAGGEIIVRAAAGRDEVVLSVSDTGSGIPPEEQERVFEAGVRLDPARPGSGLGLSVVRAIADAHGAVLSLESGPGRGSTFSLAFPVA